MSAHTLSALTQDTPDSMPSQAATQTQAQTLDQVALVVFAKAPEPGFCKTRLIPSLGKTGAALLASRLLEHTLEVALSAGFAQVELCVTPDGVEHPALARWQKENVLISGQGEGDLGQRMHKALARALTRHRYALLIGTDIPAWSVAILQAAGVAVQEQQAVFVPTLDGGYALVGLSQPAPELFLDMRWSHAQVMQETRLRAQTAGLSFVELAPIADVDEPADLVHIPKDWWSHFSPQKKD